MTSSLRDAFLEAMAKNKQSAIDQDGQPSNTQLGDIDIAAANKTIAMKFSQKWKTPVAADKRRDYSHLVGISISTLAIWLREESETPKTLIEGLNQAGYARREAVNMVNKARAMIGDFK